MNITQRSPLIIGVGLALLQLFTRGHHFASIEALPSASWAVFFLAGFYCRKNVYFLVLLAEVALLDFWAITFNNVSSFCVSPAYGLLVFAYGALWFGGKQFRRHFQSVKATQWQTLISLVFFVVVSALICDLISSGGFYFFSGRFTEPTLAEFFQRLATYFPKYLSSMALYIVFATLVHIIVGMGQQLISRNSNTPNQSAK